MKKLLSEFAEEVHLANIKWWQDVRTQQPIERNRWELLALAVSEVSECLEGERRNLMDDKLPHRKMAEVEMADTYIRLLDFSVGFEYSAYDQKLHSIIPQNKGEALFRLMAVIVEIGDAQYPSDKISLALAYIEGYCEKWSYDLWGAINEKMTYNATRKDHTHEARQIAEGKQF